MTLVEYFEEQGYKPSVSCTKENGFTLSPQTEEAFSISGKGFQQLLCMAEEEDLFPHELNDEFGVVDLEDGRKSGLYGVTL